MNPPAPPSHFSHTNQHQQQQDPNDNIVDYYAIVGVGDVLEWKKQPSSSTSSSTTSTTPTVPSSSSPPPPKDSSLSSSHTVTTTATTTTTTTTINDNENSTTNDTGDHAVNMEEMERFGREIVRVVWDTNSTTAATADRNAATMTTTTSNTNQFTNTTKRRTATGSTTNANTEYHNNNNNSNNPSSSSSSSSFTRLDTNLDWYTGVLQHQHHHPLSPPTMLYLSYQRRRDVVFHNHHPPDAATMMQHQPLTAAIADIRLFYVRIHPDTIIPQQRTSTNNNNNNTNRIGETTTTLHDPPPQQQRQQQHRTAPPTITSSHRPPKLFSDLLWKHCTAPQMESTTVTAVSVPSTTTTTLAPPKHFPSTTTTTTTTQTMFEQVLLESYLLLPAQFHQWCIPSMYQFIYHPSEFDCIPKLVETTKDWDMAWNTTAAVTTANNDKYCYIPVVAIRQQSVTEEQRYYEDAAITNIRIVGGAPGTQSQQQQPGQYHTTAPNIGKGGSGNELDDPYRRHRNVDDCGNYQNEYDDDDDDDDDDSDIEDKFNTGTYHVLGQTKWTTTTAAAALSSASTTFAIPTIQIRRNRPNGFCDMTFTTRVIGRFPYQNYDTVPLPQEEIPMFCYPKLGCHLFRTQYFNIPLVQYYGFVVKNERGDSIYVSCVSFMEPLTTMKINQLEQLSYQRRFTSIPHYQHYIQQQQQREEKYRFGNPDTDFPPTECKYNNPNGGCLVTAFTDVTTFENKTICLVSRYPYWTAFRKFLSHLHMITTSAVPSDVPIERYISHLLLSVPVPRPGGPNTIVPLPALNTPMILSLPHEKDFPLLDLPYNRLFSCLDVKTIVTVVLGLLSLERKVIIMSTRPSLVLDVAELLRSLLFPFELCAPYVPRLTEPFKSSLNFPGAIFVGIHDDSDPNGLAAMVKASYPEESTVIDLDTGEIDCDGDRYEAITSLWNMIPSIPRTALVNELEALCRDADIVDGQEPLESLMDSAFYVDLTDAVDGNDINMDTKKSLDDRCIRDAFLRFFCSLLGGYERFLVVPDANFLVSGDEWFDASGFLASVPSGNTAYLTSLVSTQLFQSFIQRRTEASDIHCMLFDECLTEFHSTSVPYGRLGGDVETIRSDESSQPQLLYSLLVDQSASMANPGYDPTSIAINRSMDASDADSSFTMNMSRAVGSVAETSVMHSESVVSYAGDLITVPSTQDLPPGSKYMYCLDGNPCFPHRLNPDLFLPREPSSWTITLTKNPDPLLARSERELEEANRRHRVAISQIGVTQRRCLWQLPKLMGSHFLGSWLLCTPALVSQVHLSHDQQSRYLLRALGALRLLRSRHRIVPDEAAYRALIVACGRTQSDRRVELVKLFGLLRSHGIFPSAVTLGQYTKALAEGYSKRLIDVYKTDEHGVEVSVSHDPFNLEDSLNNLDTSLYVLEYQGRRWQQRSGLERGMSTDNGDDGAVDAKMKRIDSRIWQPVVYSSSFVPCSLNRSLHDSEPTRLFAIWSRTRRCSDCSYVPLEEEVQAGWDAFHGKHDIPGAIGCPRCDAAIVPMLAFREMSIDEAMNIYPNSPQEKSFSEPGLDYQELPPQIGPIVESDLADEGISYVTYINPAVLREALEHYVEEYGDGILDRDQLRDLDPEIFVNFWWYCARFSLPLPLPTSVESIHMCAFAAWDRSTAERGCFSAAKAIQPILRPPNGNDDNNTLATTSDDPSQMEVLDDFPLLSRFNLQGFYSNVWDHPDLSKLLVALVEACDKRDFRGVAECAVRCNKRRLEAFGNLPNATMDDSHFGTINSLAAFGNDSVQPVDLDVYRVILYLAKYQCTSAFHSFFPATLKPCKGYHFWCAIGTPLPTFDRLFRDAVRRVNSNTRVKSLVNTHDLTDVALAFRCVFGHLI